MCLQGKQSTRAFKLNASKSTSAGTATTNCAVRFARIDVSTSGDALKWNAKNTCLQEVVETCGCMFHMKCCVWRSVQMTFNEMLDCVSKEDVDVCSCE
jgi:hypothetical protein